uniref:SXP/RAL-2 family protein Ani s 5-like cation-binding domain-containing protein n=1 Tax=Panagrolaimus superbus TaxID=310955 RepID=A0A914Y7D2_9BILA
MTISKLSIISTVFLAAFVAGQIQQSNNNQGIVPQVISPQVSGNVAANSGNSNFGGSVVPQNGVNNGGAPGMLGNNNNNGNNNRGDASSSSSSSSLLGSLEKLLGSLIANIHLTPGLNQTELSQLFTIIKNQNLTKSQVKTQIEQWASRQNQNMQKLYNDATNKVTQEMSNINTEINAKAATLSTQAKSAYDQYKAIISNDGISRKEECEKLDSISASLDSTIRQELFQAFGSLRMCPKSGGANQPGFNNNNNNNNNGGFGGQQQQWGQQQNGFGGAQNQGNSNGFGNNNNNQFGGFNNGQMGGGNSNGDFGGQPQQPQQQNGFGNGGFGGGQQGNSNNGNFGGQQQQQNGFDANLPQGNSNGEFGSNNFNNNGGFGGQQQQQQQNGNLNGGFGGGGQNGGGFGQQPQPNQNGGASNNQAPFG